MNKVKSNDRTSTLSFLSGLGDLHILDCGSVLAGYAMEEKIKSYEKCVKKKECEIYDTFNGEMLPVTLARTCNEYQDAEMLKEKKEFAQRVKPLKLDERTKEELYAKFTESLENGFRCVYCDEKVDLKWGTKLSFSIDHTIPRKLGGRDEVHNLKFICTQCNEMKGDSQPD